MTQRSVAPDFGRFWSGLAVVARGIEPAVALDDGETIRFSSVGGERIGAWLILPEAAPSCAVVVGHGYGGRASPDVEWCPPGAAMLFPVARGLPALSLRDDIPVDSHEHVLHGIASRESYVLGHCAADLVWCAISALEEAVGQRLGQRRGGLRTTYVGTSFGGGIGSLAAPWDERLDAVALVVPTFGANVQRLGVEATGSGASLSRHVQRDPTAWSVLDYFDAATAATRLSVPTLVAPALIDPVVPPVGQWAVGDAVPWHVRTVVPLSTGHMEDDPDEIEGLRRKVRELAAGPSHPASDLQNGW